MIVLLFHFIGKFVRVDRTAAERKIAALQPAAGGESCEQDSFSENQKYDQSVFSIFPTSFIL